MASTSVTRPLYSARHDDIRQGHVNPTFVNYSDEMNTNLASALPSSQDTSPHNLATGDVIIEITSCSFNTNSSTFSEASLAASNLSAVNPSIGSGKVSERLFYLHKQQQQQQNQIKLKDNKR